MCPAFTQLIAPAPGSTIAYSSVAIWLSTASVQSSRLSCSSAVAGSWPSSA